MEKLEMPNREMLEKASNGAIVGLTTIQEMIADHDERIFRSAMLSRIEEIKILIKMLKELAN